MKQETFENIGVLCRLPRRDFAVERLLSMSDVRAVDELEARRAARLRDVAGGKGSAVDAIVVAVAELVHATVLTQDARDLTALAAGTTPPVRVERV